MKSLFFTSIPLLALVSCAPIYQCGEPAPDKTPLMTKRTEAVFSERNRLCEDLSAEKQTNEELKAENAKKQAEIEQRTAENQDLKKKYDQLADESLSKAAQYDATLQQKAKELEDKERLLGDRERALAEMKAVIARQDSITQRLNDIIRNALLGFSAEDLQVEIKNGKVYVSMSDKLLFRSGSAEVEPKGREALQALGDVLSKNPDIDILVEGHTDNIPIKTAVFKDNWDLSVGRATDIVRILTDVHKIAPTRLTASGKGEFMPRDTNESPEGRARNRRTEIILSPKLDELMDLLGK